MRSLARRMAIPWMLGTGIFGMSGGDACIAEEAWRGRVRYVHLVIRMIGCAYEARSAARLVHEIRVLLALLV